MLRCCDGNGTLTSPVLLSWPLLVFSFSSGPLQFNGSAADSTSSPLHLCCDGNGTVTSPVLLSWPLHRSISSTLVSTNVSSTLVGNRLGFNHPAAS
ncbi:hypothetical protein LINPERHAP2_LOCUS32352 [Linum perenne]